jgi:photosystem II stability/assembly factor-like uncharacterized protein
MRKILLGLFGLFLSLSLFAQKKSTPSTPSLSYGDSLLQAQLKYRLVGPFRGGRSGAVTGSVQNKQVFYFGSTGGGVWKTMDGGSNWSNVSDKYFGGSIGAVTVAPSDDNIVYAGEGEGTMRGNVSEGLGGIWRTDDGGRTWKNLGLKDTRHIVSIVVHPRNPDIVWAAVMGHLFGPNPDRGVYKSTDGGKTWKKVLYANEQTGACSLVMEPGNPQVLYAGTWRLLRTPYSLESGGEGSGLWKSADGGDTWTSIKTRKGLPKGVWGVIGVAVAPSNPDKVFALIENANGGLYMSSDAGETWSLQTSDNNIRQRAWYYSRVFVDPKNEDLVYCPNVEFMVSHDGGKTFKSEYDTPHGDHHDLWIDPSDGKRMIVADDGGAQVSYDGGNNWSTYMNQPTSQIYRLSTDNHNPYRILGAQQDNSALRILHRSNGAAITESDWGNTAGGESGFIVADPLNPDIVYGGSYGGFLMRIDHKTEEYRLINVWPDNPMGAGADVQKYRFQWNFPMFFSPHNPKRLYAAGNNLFVTENEGASWEKISPDLTTNDKKRQASSGGPITQDNTGVEYYCTIFTAAESPLEKDLLWTGSDDGLIHVSKDGGKNWENVTPRDCPQWMMWNSVEPDPFQKGAAIFAGTRYKLDDYRPYVYRTEDYGKTWKLLTNGINPLHFTRVVRADPKRKGLLYAGTEFGMYISYDGGANWRTFQLNLPMVPVTDLHIRDNDLIVATQGRAIWMLDDLTLLQERSEDIVNKPLYVYPARPAVTGTGARGGRRGGGGGAPKNAGQNPPKGVVIPYYLKDVTDSTSLTVDVMDKEHKLISSYSTSSAENPVSVKKGHNQFVWNAFYPDAEKSDGLILWNGMYGSPAAPPGNYYAKFKSGKDSMERSFTIVADPNSRATQADYDEQFQFLMTVQGKYNEIMKTLKGSKEIKAQLSDFTARNGKDITPAVKAQIDTINKQLTTIEETLHQTKAKSGQDVLNYPIRLDDKISGIYGVSSAGKSAPSRQAKESYAELASEADKALADFKRIENEEIPKLNRLVKESNLPVFGRKKG